MEEDKIIQERKEKALKFLKEKYDWISYIVLAIIVYIASYIRTRPLPGLRDISTGGWTLGPDLDPFLFLRWAKYIVEHGSLFTYDSMRYVPLGYNTEGEFVFLPYLIAWFHKVVSFLGISSSIEQSASYYPVFFFAITVIAFFFLVREMFKEHFDKFSTNAIALIASFFLSVIPALLPRTIAGIPEKESTAFFFLFVGLYFFLRAWKAKSSLSRYTLAVLAGLGTAGMTLIWGGSDYLYATIAVSVFLAFLFGQMNKEKLYIYGIWFSLSFFIASIFSTRYNFLNVLTSTISGTTIAVFFLIAFNLFFFKYIEKYLEGRGKISKIPKPILSTLVAVIILTLIITLFFGTGVITSNVKSIISVLISPTQSRFGVTVAENRQPFFNEWASNFGPTVSGIPLVFWLFVIGSIHLFYFTIKNVFRRSESIIITTAYTIFLMALIFSRYSPESILNGTNGTSLLVYSLGFLILLGTFGYYYYQYFNNKEEGKLKEISLSLILIFIFYFLAIVSARGGVRVIMVLVPPASIIVGYFIMSMYNYALGMKDNSMKIYAWIILAVMVIAALYSGQYLYKQSIATAQGYIPSSYTQQWQKAMGWVRENTPQNAVFAHWWDYGYWVQTMGLRATILDGGNAITYWDHLMGRYVLTGKNDAEALEFLYSHNATHLLIDSTDIGKYSAFSSIGSDQKYDRFSFLPVLVKDPKQTTERKNSTLDIFTGGSYLDEDVVFMQNDSKIFLPGGKAGLAGIILEKNAEGNMVSAPVGVYVYQGKQYNLPLRYAFVADKLLDFKTGLDAGVFIIPQLSQTPTGLQLDRDGTLLYLSNRTVQTQFARLYLYKEDDPAFKLVHSEDDALVAQVKSSVGGDLRGDFVYYGELRGPIRIWEIKYPAGLKVNPEYLLNYYPDKSIIAA